MMGRCVGPLVTSNSMEPMLKCAGGGENITLSGEWRKWEKRAKRRRHPASWMFFNVIMTYSTTSDGGVDDGAGWQRGSCSTDCRAGDLHPRNIVFMH